MPSAKEVRARQNRQKERIAIALAERQKAQRRRRRWGAGVVAVLIVVGLIFAILEGGNSGGSKVAVTPPTTVATTPTTTTPTTTKPLASVKGKPCVGLKSTLPKGSPPMFIVPGPAPTKLTINDIKVGTGAVVPRNATVTVNYVGVACSTGEIFDSSYSRNQTFQANLNGQVIAGWEQGIPGMRIGGVRQLGIPAALAYGAAGSPPIAPDEALFFVVSAVKLG